MPDRTNLFVIGMAINYLESILIARHKFNRRNSLGVERHNNNDVEVLLRMVPEGAVLGQPTRHDYPVPPSCFFSSCGKQPRNFRICQSKHSMHTRAFS